MRLTGLQKSGELFSNYSDTRPMTKHPYTCKENDNEIIVCDGRQHGDGIELHIGDGAEPSWLVIGLDDLTAALQQIGITLTLPAV